MDALLAAAAGISTLLGLASLIAVLYFQIVYDRTRRSVQSTVADRGVSAEAIVRILQEFKEDATRITALQACLKVNERETKRYYDKLKGIHADTILTKQNRHERTILSVVGVFFLGLAAITAGYLVIRQSRDQPGEYPTGRDDAPGVAGPPQAELDEPKLVVQQLLAAWKRGDRDAASRIAGPQAVDSLFGESALTEPVNSSALNCYPVGTGQFDCDIPYADGHLIFRVIEVDQGWWVESVAKHQ